MKLWNNFHSTKLKLYKKCEYFTDLPFFGLYSVTEIERNEFNKYLISSLFCRNGKTGGCIELYREVVQRKKT